MCLLNTPNQPSVKTPSVPEPNPNASLMAENRVRRAGARGTSANIFTSALGDSTFGSSISVPGAAKLGQTNVQNGASFA